MTLVGGVLLVLWISLMLVAERKLAVMPAEAGTHGTSPPRDGHRSALRAPRRIEAVA